MRGVIVVIGEALIDLLVRPDGRTEATAGGDRSASRTIARLGQRVAFAGRLSTDVFGHRLRHRLVSDGVDLGLIVETDDPTTLAVVESGVTGDVSYRFYLVGTSAPGLGMDAVEAIVSPAVLHIGTLGLVLEPIGSTVEAVVGRMPPETLVMADLNARPSATRDRAAWVARIERLLGRMDVGESQRRRPALLPAGRGSHPRCHRHGRERAERRAPDRWPAASPDRDHPRVADRRSAAGRGRGHRRRRRCVRWRLQLRGWPVVGAGLTSPTATRSSRRRRSQSEVASIVHPPRRRSTDRIGPLATLGRSGGCRRRCVQPVA